MTTNEPLIPLPPPWQRPRLRNKMGVTIKQAALEIGVSERTYMRWEQGHTAPAVRNHRKYYEQLTNWAKTLHHT